MSRSQQRIVWTAVTAFFVLGTFAFLGTRDSWTESSPVATAAAATDEGPEGTKPAGDQTCAATDESQVRAGESQLDSDFYPHQLWAANPRAQENIAALDAFLLDRFGNYGDWVSNGLVGVDLNHSRQVIDVVVDSTIVDVDSLRREIQGLPIDSVKIEVSRSCSRTEELSDVLDGLEKLGSSRKFDESFAFYVDADTSTVLVIVESKTSELAKYLRGQYGDLITFAAEGGVMRAGRQDDGEPHRGGAAIRQPGQGINTCSSGFAVRILSTDALGSVTAGHCFGNSQLVYSGPEFYGEAFGKTNYPTFDMMRIHPAGQTFSKNIYTTPGPPNVRTVVASGNSALGAFVCGSGMVTFAICGLEVMNMDATFCPPDGCTPNLMTTRRDNDVIVRDGDSGGPVYNRFGSSDAAIRGMIIGRSGSGQTMFSHKTLTIENHLDVRVAIAP